MNPIPYRISKIETSQFAIFPKLFVNGQNVRISTSANFALKTDLSEIRNSLMIEYYQGTQLLLVLQINCYFEIAPEGIDSIKEERRIPVSFLRYMATISTGAARGIIHAKTEGSVLNSIILSPINLVELLKEDFPINPDPLAR